MAGNIANPLRVALAGFSHETNSFASRKVDLDILVSSPLLRGEEIIRAHTGKSSPCAGFIEAAAADDQVELIPTAFASVLPMGLVGDEVFEFMMGEIVRRLKADGPWDGVLLDLHGAGVSESYEDLDGEILRRIRELVGPHVKVGTTLDMHANVSPLMVSLCDAVNLYSTNPHLDTGDRAYACARLLFRAARGEISPVCHLIQLPLVINILKQATSDEPLASLMEMVASIERRTDVLSASFGLGYPYSDSPKMGSSVLVITDGDPSAAEHRATVIAETAWEMRDELQGRASTAWEAAQAVLGDRGPVVLLDVGDNVGGGTEGDSTVLVHALLENGVDGVFVVITDDRAAASCHEAGVGGEVSLRIGGRSSDLVGPPWAVVGVVERLSDGRFDQSQPSHGGRPHQDVGPTAVVATRSATVMITSRPFMPFSTEPYEELGLDISRFRAVVAKGVIAPRAGFMPITDRFLMVDTPGPSAADFQVFQFHRRRTPMYPFEPDAGLGAAVHTRVS